MAKLVAPEGGKKELSYCNMRCWPMSRWVIRVVLALSATCPFVLQLRQEKADMRSAFKSELFRRHC